MTSSNAARCVIHGRVSIRPSSISPMIFVKSCARALREQSSVPSGRWKTGWRNFTSSVVMPTKTSRPPWAIRPKALDIEPLWPVASMTTSGRWPSVSSRRSRSTDSDSRTVCRTPMTRRQFARDVRLAGRHQEARPQSAVAVDTERLRLLAAVGLAAGAGVARLAVDVRLDGAAVAGTDVGDARPDRLDLDAQLVAGDA